MVHGDDRGLRIPPRLAPVQVLVLLVKDSTEAQGAARRLAEELAAVGVRCRLDDRTDIPFGRRAVDASSTRTR
jgi:prolyl-tRNA synthetase